MIRIVKVYKRYWWPHIYARERRLLWVKVVVGVRYFVDGVETDLYGNPAERYIDKFLSEVSERRLADGSEPVTVKLENI